MEIQFGDCIFDGQFGDFSETFKNFVGVLSEPGFISMKIFLSLIFPDFVEYIFVTVQC